MNLSVNKKSRSRSRNRSNRFQKLWKRAERLQRDNRVLDRKLDALVGRVRSEIIPVQFELGETARDLVLHLLPFLRRKSLSRWERAEIREWIDEQLEVVVALGLMDDPLKQALARDMALQMDYAIDEHSELSPYEQVQAEWEREDREFDDSTQGRLQEMIDEEVERMVRARFGKPRSRAPVDDLFEAELDAAEQAREAEIERFRRDAAREVRQRFESEFGWSIPDETGEYVDDGFLDEESPEPDFPPGTPADATRGSRDANFLNRLFRRTANVLHPDKEQDEARRQRLQGLMGTLLEARRKGDVLTVFALHKEHVGADAEVSANDEKQLFAALQRQLENLAREKDAIINQSPAHAHAHGTFLAASAKETDRRIAAVIAQTRRYAAELREIIDEVKTLKSLKPLLDQRANRRGMRFIIDEMLDDSF